MARPLPAEQQIARPPVQQATFQGVPVWFHPTDSAGALRTDDSQAFDPDDAIACIQFEHYLADAPAVDGRRLKALYYLLKPLLPRGLQLELQRANARRRMQAVRFPAWPQDDTLTRLLGALLGERMAAAGVERVPCIGFWPRGKAWAWCLTHDIDTGRGQNGTAALAAVEEARQLRSCWYFVPERYPVDHELMAALRGAGHEIGVHGLQHSGKLFASRTEFDWRVKRINEYVHQWQVTGFRSPATYRNPYWLPEIEVDHDSSYMDNARFEPQRGGVCAPFPFMLSERLVELPISLPMDHTLQNILRQDVVAANTAKLDWVRRQHGLAVALFHPDYNTDDASRGRYGAVLDALAADATGWFALPREVADWWQRRRRSRIVTRDGAPAIEGPAAADGAIWWIRRDGGGIAVEPS